jgi:hypothetical protein
VRESQGRTRLGVSFTGSADPARRAAFATAAETLIARNRTTVVVGPLTTVALLIVSIVMLKGAFPRPWPTWASPPVSSASARHLDLPASGKQASGRGPTDQAGTTKNERARHRGNVPSGPKIG